MKVVWSSAAVDELESIWEYVAQDSPQSARNLIGKLIAAVDRLERFPALGRAVPEDERRTARELLVQSYRIMYEIRGERVEILGVVHGSQDLGTGLPPWERLRSPS